MKKALFRNGVVVADGLKVIDVDDEKYGLITGIRRGVARAVKIGDMVAEFYKDVEDKDLGSHDREFVNKNVVESYILHMYDDDTVDIEFGCQYVEVEGEY